MGQPIRVNQRATAMVMQAIPRVIAAPPGLLRL